MDKLEWVATYRDGTIKRQEFNVPDLPYNGDMDTTEVKTYFIQKGEGIMCGVDVDKQIFVINGGIVHNDLPHGDYQLITFKRIMENSNGSRIERFCFGLQGNIRGKNHKRVVFLNQDGSYQLALKT